MRDRISDVYLTKKMGKVKQISDLQIITLVLRFLLWMSPLALYVWRTVRLSVVIFYVGESLYSKCKVHTSDW